MALCAILVIPIWWTQSIDNLWGAVMLIGLATAAHQAFSANLYTIPGDVFPRKAVGSVIGIGGMVGGIGGMIMAKGVGKALSTSLGYPAIFAVCAFIYLGAILAVHLLSPKMEPVEV